jgi:hypothetical protein
LAQRILALIKEALAHHIVSFLIASFLC